MTPLTADQVTALTQLYRDGAWTQREVLAHFSRGQANTLLKQGILTSLHTDMGVMFLLAAGGRELCMPAERYTCSPARQLDQAYVRLCAKDFGWRESTAPLAASLDLRARGFGRLRQYSTAHGPALVAGKLCGGGYSLKGMMELADRLRASALRYNFRVIILTPRARRGRTLAARDAAFFQVIHHLPKPNVTPPSPPRVRPVPPPSGSHPDPDSGPAITPYIAQQWQARGVPHLTLQILQLTRAERVEQFLADLEVDGVISAGQRDRHYALKHRDLAGTLFVVELVRPVHGRPSFEFLHRFYCAGKAQARQGASSLGNQAGTGELRRQLSATADPGTWLLEPRSKHRTYEPDATWHSSEDAVAVEYDAGFYNMTTISFKIEKFRQKGLPTIVWGTPSSLRARRLKEQFDVDARVCKWW